MPPLATATGTEVEETERAEEFAKRGTSGLLLLRGVVRDTVDGGGVGWTRLGLGPVTTAPPPLWLAAAQDGRYDDPSGVPPARLAARHIAVSSSRIAPRFRGGTLGVPIRGTTVTFELPVGADRGCLAWEPEAVATRLLVIEGDVEKCGMAGLVFLSAGEGVQGLLSR